MKKIVFLLAAVLIVLAGALALADETHEHTYVLMISQEEHWKECSVCGFILFRESHYGFTCDLGEPHCYFCGVKASDGVFIPMYEHEPPYDPSAFQIGVTAHTYICPVCGQVVSEKHVAFCPDTGVCSYCGASEAEDGIAIAAFYHLNHSIADYSVHDARYHQFLCASCGEVVLEAHKYIGDSPICSMCGFDRRTAPEPPKIETRQNQTVCGLGIRFRDIAPELTEKWYMFTPLDLSRDSSQSVSLIAGNIYRVGSVNVNVKDGKVTVTYSLNRTVDQRDLAFTLLPDLASVMDVENLNAYAFDKEISIADDLGGDTSVLLYVLGHVDYEYGEMEYRMFYDTSAEYKDLVSQLKDMMD